jgi:hypothetical protein
MRWRWYKSSDGFARFIPKSTTVEFRDGRIRPRPSPVHEPGIPTDAVASSHTVFKGHGYSNHSSYSNFLGELRHLRD